jgi:hypothetical protein
MIHTVFYSLQHKQPQYVSHHSSYNRTFARYKSEEKHHKIKKYSFLLAIAIGLVATVAFGKNPEPIEASTQQALYCEMVSLHKQDKSLGWPDFKGNYSEVCD